MAEKKEACVVLDGLFLVPCWALAEQDLGPGKEAGLHVRELYDLKKRAPSRSFAVLRTNKRDLILNHCPFCGVQINEMWVEETAN